MLNQQTTNKNPLFLINSLLKGEVLISEFIQKLEIKEGFLKNRKIILNNVPDDERIKNALRSFSTGEEGVLLEINMGTGTSEAYTIEIETEKVSISSDGCAGVFYAIQTLRQIFEQKEIPCCYYRRQA